MKLETIEYLKHGKSPRNGFEVFSNLYELNAAATRYLDRMKAAGSDYKLLLRDYNGDVIQSFESENFKQRVKQ